MWLLSALTGLILTICCRAAPQQWRNIYDYDVSRYFDDRSAKRDYETAGAPYPRSFSSENVCGIRNPEGVGDYRMADYGDAEFGEFPWIVGLFVNHESKNNPGRFEDRYNCAGSLIHREAVLTAAHCVDKYSRDKISIRAGEWDSSTVSEKYPYQKRSVKKMIIHDEYDALELAYDLAILILSYPVYLAPNVGLVCLPPQNYGFRNCRCFAGGWGRDGNEYAPFRDRLKEIEIPIVNQTRCEKALRLARRDTAFTLDPSFICAGEGNIDLCTGDSGAPLVCAVPEYNYRYTQAGVASWGEGCGMPGVPGVYAKVSTEREWIDETLYAAYVENLLIT